MKDYLKVADVFPSEIYTDDESGSLIVDDDGVILESFSGDKVAYYVLHAINSHDELVAINKELLGIINRIIDTSTELEGKAVSSPWSEGYKQCSIDTGKAIIEMLGRIEGGEK